MGNSQSDCSNSPKNNITDNKGTGGDINLLEKRLKQVCHRLAHCLGLAGRHNFSLVLNRPKVLHAELTLILSTVILFFKQIEFLFCRVYKLILMIMFYDARFDGKVDANVKASPVPNKK